MKSEQETPRQQLIIRSINDEHRISAETNTDEIFYEIN